MTRLITGAETDNIPMVTAPGAAVQGTSGAWYYSLSRAAMIRTVNAYLMPKAPVTEDQFDPNGVFDRAENADFHRIYTAADDWSEGEVS